MQISGVKSEVPAAILFSVCNKFPFYIVLLILSLQFPITAIREIKILKKLHHENVIKLKEIVTSPGTFFNDLNLLLSK